ncbi:hypothetical protein SteCoe_25066 [Stentor coeruleus]|uniref:GAR domain-containing protein n=1 Tax=Stentor coeruleus TaxID=5963 RepID=A0A1R2BG67_9CILI|nr:hypothetical protein SteCoe_25066 [Stentor coeruleus]
MDEKKARCPFLDSLATGKNKNTESLEKIWRNRDSNCPHHIKISIEPESPSHSESDVICTAEEINSLTFERLQQMSGHHLKQVVRALCQEVQDLESISIKLPELRNELNGKIQERRDLEKKCQLEIEEIKTTWARKKQEVQELQEKRKQSKNYLVENQTKARQLEAELDILKAHLGDVQRENLLIQMKKLQYEDCSKSKDELEQLLRESQQYKNLLIEKANVTEKNLKNSVKKTQDDIEEIAKDNVITKKKIEETNKEYNDAHVENGLLQARINELKAKLHDAQTLKKQVKTAAEAHNAKARSRDSVDDKIDKIIKEMEIKDKNILKKHQELLNEEKKVSDELRKIEETVEGQENLILDLHKSTFDATAQKISHEQTFCIRADIGQLSDDIYRLNHFYTSMRTDILGDLESGSRILMDEGEKVFSQVEKLEQMIESVERKEEELHSLKGTMGNAKKRVGLYVPVNEDPVDVALAEYLNSREDPIQVKFVRQEGGNYTFGSMRIYIKIENEKMLVRVRGGFTSIEEFINIYSSSEAEANNTPSPNRDSSRSPTIIRSSLANSPKKK